ncbi:MAG: hypothetical protein V2I53_11100, partial [Paracoccaceae bacterium]|nr:hypothetical protein [Paracoccaceae bacterium]
TDVVRVKTIMGELDAFVLETDIKGIEGTSFAGKTISYWSPDLAVTVYEKNTSANWRAELTLTTYKRP